MGHSQVEIENIRLQQPASGANEVFVDGTERRRSKLYLPGPIARLARFPLGTRGLAPIRPRFATTHSRTPREHRF